MYHIVFSITVVLAASMRDGPEMLKSRNGIHDVHDCTVFKFYFFFTHNNTA